MLTDFKFLSNNDEIKIFFEVGDDIGLVLVYEGDQDLGTVHSMIDYIKNFYEGIRRPHATLQEEMEDIFNQHLRGSCKVFYSISPI